MQQKQRKSILVLVDLLVILILAIVVLAAVAALGYGIFAGVTFAPEFSIGLGVVTVIALALVWLWGRNDTNPDNRIGNGWLK